MANPEGVRPSSSIIYSYDILACFYLFFLGGRAQKGLAMMAKLLS
jgi:hypothetical protein